MMNGLYKSDAQIYINFNYIRIFRIHTIICDIRQFFKDISRRYRILSTHHTDSRGLINQSSIKNQTHKKRVNERKRISVLRSEKEGGREG